MTRTCPEDVCNFQRSLSLSEALFPSSCSHRMFFMSCLGWECSLTLSKPQSINSYTYLTSLHTTTETELHIKASERSLKLSKPDGFITRPHRIKWNPTSGHQTSVIWTLGNFTSLVKLLNGGIFVLIVHGYYQRLEEGVKASGVGVTGACELPNIGTWTHLCPLKEKQTLVSVEPLSSPHLHCLKAQWGDSKKQRLFYIEPQSGSWLCQASLPISLNEER